ncbi:MAG: hypothetical protein HC828_14935 [Blastochloris sp.]|nr:hypothetical protein [Blastochloris sp.]
MMATPIGNLQDITLRALQVLADCDVVLCEDTRVTKKILERHAIKKPLVSYHAHSGEAKYDKVFALLSEGKHLVLVSDAGTPTVSDPGAQLVYEVRRRFAEAVTIEAIPGPSALTAALNLASAHRSASITMPPPLCRSTSSAHCCGGMAGWCSSRVGCGREGQSS